MKNLFYFSDVIYLILEISIVYFSLLIIIKKNPVHSILSLICVYFFSSIYLIILNMDFIGISYLLIYIGALSILFLFVLMLLDIRISEIYIENINRIFIHILMGLIIYIPISLTSESFFNIQNIENYPGWENIIIGYNDISSIGATLYDHISILLIMALLILLLAMVGAIVINLND